MNHFTGIGRLTEDPEVRFTPTGTQVATFRLAVDPERKDGKTLFIRVDTFGKVADAVAEYCPKGREVAVDGYLDYHEWTDKGERHSYISATANRVKFLRPAQGQSSTAGEPDEAATDEEQF